MGLKFRDREYTFFYMLDYVDLKGKTIPELLSEARKEGEFSLPWQVTVARDGDITLMRPLEAVAGSQLDWHDLGIHILVDALDTKHMTRIQRMNLHDFLEKLKKTYTDIEDWTEKEKEE